MFLKSSKSLDTVLAFVDNQPLVLIYSLDSNLLSVSPDSEAAHMWSNSLNSQNKPHLISKVAVDFSNSVQSALKANVFV